MLGKAHKMSVAETVVQHHLQNVEILSKHIKRCSLPEERSLVEDVERGETILRHSDGNGTECDEQSCRSKI